MGDAEDTQKLTSESHMKSLVGAASHGGIDIDIYADFNKNNRHFMAKHIFLNLIRRSKTSLDMVLGGIHTPFLEDMASEMRKSSSQIRVITSPYLADKYLSGISEISAVNNLEDKLKIGYCVISDKDAFWFSPFVPVTEGEVGTASNFNSPKFNRRLSYNFQLCWEKYIKGKVSRIKGQYEPGIIVI